MTEMIDDIRRTCRDILSRAGDPLTLHMEVSNYLWQTHLGGSLTLEQCCNLYAELVIGKQSKDERE